MSSMIKLKVVNPAILWLKRPLKLLQVNRLSSCGVFKTKTDPSKHAASNCFLHRSQLSLEKCVSVEFVAPSAAAGSTFRVFNGGVEQLDSHRRGEQRYRGQEGARCPDIHQEAAER